MVSIIGTVLVALGVILYTIGFIRERRRMSRERGAIESALKDAGYV